jgi:DHA2 family multidrug resistance protein-like MFS transporter
MTGADAPRAGRREWIGLAVIALPCVLYSMDLTVLYLAVPSLAADLGPSSTELLWITDIYGFFLAGFLITMGTLGDRIGRRRLLLIGAAAFGFASVLAAFSTSVEMLIVSRALLGVAAATLAPSTLSLIRNMFLDPGQRTFAIGVWTTSFAVGAAIGPLLGGILLEFFWWGSVFLLAVPVMASLLVVGPRLLPEYRDPAAGRLDLISAGLSVIAVLSVVYGLKQIAESGFGVTPAASILTGFAVGAVFVRRQRALTEPLIDLGLFRSPVFSTSLAVTTLTFVVNFGILFFVAQYLQLVLGMSPLEAGLWTVPPTLAFIVGALLVGVIARRIGAGVAITAGLMITTVGLIVLTQADANSELALIVAGSALVSFGVAAPINLGTDLVVGSVPPERAGMASGISETGAELGGALGIAVLGSIAVAVYRNQVDEALPTGVDPDQAEAAKDTLGGAMSVVEDLGGERGEMLLGAAQEAFAQGMQAAALAAAVVALGTALLAALFLRRARTEPEPEPNLLSASAGHEAGKVGTTSACA